MIRTALTLTAAVFLTAGSAYAQATNAQGQFYTVVRYSDLNLNKQEDARTFLTRIHRAIQSVCVVRSEFKSCEQAALKNAVDRAGSPLVTALATPASGPTQVASR